MMNSVSTDKPLVSEELKPDVQDSDVVANTAKALDMVKENPELLKNHGKYKVPVYYAPSRAMIRPPATPGLTQFIEQAMTEKEVLNLLNKSKEYKHAQAKTVRRWEQAAAKRIAEIKTQK